jgi:ElaB/YqjD/DUF883 family membrane-anchored ribosome-binding protein
MGEEPRTGGTQVTDQGTREPAEIRSDIEATRRELGDTVETLAAKADVKAQAQKKVARVRQSVDARRRKLMGKVRQATPDSAGSAASGAATKARENPVSIGLVGAFVVGLLIGRLLSRGY